MQENRNESGWLSLPNPFAIRKDINSSTAIIGHVSGRRTDIIRILMNEQSAHFLVGAPNIGKSTLIRYLQQSTDAEWSWRNELADLRDQLKLSDTHFVEIDLKSLESIAEPNELLSCFIGLCVKALHSASQQGKQPTSFSSDLKELRELLRTIIRESPNARYFIMLDSIERLEKLRVQSFFLDKSKAKTPLERGIALLDHSNVIRTLVELMDEFRMFGVIFSVQSLPRPKFDDQFHHVSLDLARFTTMILQAFTWDDATEFLAQSPENFGTDWVKKFKELGGSYIFSMSEQAWLLQQAGTHPYLLQQFCLYTFQSKQEYADIHGNWPELQERDKLQLGEYIIERLSTFLPSIWQRLQEAMENSSHETKSKFNEFISLLSQRQAGDVIDLAFWDYLGAELRYILYSEGIVRYDLYQPIRFPGATLSNYLAQKTYESNEQPPAPIAGSGRILIIKQPGNPQVQISLSELEYRLLKALLQHPKRCTEEELMMGAWGKKIDRPVFTQRMHQLRKKLKGTGENDLIENRYGGIYTLNNADWLYLE